MQRRPRADAARAVRQQPDRPSQFSKAALFIAGKLPKADDDCGKLTYSVPVDANEGQSVAKVDYQWSQNHTIFGRYLGTFRNDLPPWPRSGNVWRKRRLAATRWRTRPPSATRRCSAATP
jgi:hypothetical protein